MAAKALSTTKRVEIIDKKKFVVAALNVDNKAFVIFIAALAERRTIPIYFSYQAQVAMLTNKEIGILVEYSNFSNVFSSNSAAELPEHTKINNHPINLLDDKQPLYNLIYSLGPVKIETLKTYIKANLASSFIRLFKFSPVL